MFVSEFPPTIHTHSQIAREEIPKPRQETREFFTFKELHPNVTDAVFPEISSTWFNEDEDDEDFDDKWSTHVAGRFTCNNNLCKKRFWYSGTVTIEIKRYEDNGYSTIVYNQRCKSCNWLGTFKLDEQSYIKRVAYRLKRWAGVRVEMPPFNQKQTREHERAYCEGCKRGKCLQGDGSRLY
jgi:hypothetical protein